MSMVSSGIAKQLKKSHNQEAAAIKKEMKENLKKLHAENPDIPKSFRMHTNMTIFPAIAAYKALRNHGVETETAVDYIGNCFNKPCDIYGNFLRFGITVLHLVHKVPALFVKISLNMYPMKKGDELGFEYRLPEKQDPRVSRFDITNCPYLTVCQKYNCSELMRAFCDSDDHKYSRMHKNLLWDRTGTIGKGSECCDFRLVDISRYPDYKRMSREVK